MTEERENCNFQQNYNVFGLDDKPCCYLYHKYCDDIENCYFKRCKRLEQENEKLRKALEEIKEVANTCKYVGCSSECKYRDDCPDLKDLILTKINECIGG